MIRAANRSEYPQLRDLFFRAFGADETDLFDCLAAHDPACVPEHIRVAEGPDGQPIAATILLPRQVRTRQGWAPGAIITLVAADPDVQRQGFGGATVRDALACARAQGLAVALLYGHPSYYPRFGFVPVLPHAEFLLSAAAGAETLVPLTDADLSWMTDLYHQQVATAPCAMVRPAERWLWTSRNPARQIYTLAGRQGYAFLTPMPDKQMLSVHEAAAADAGAARRLLAGLRGLAAAQGLEKVRLALSPENLVARTAAVLGAEQHRFAASPGMACVLDWAPLLPSGYSVAEGSLLCDGRTVLTASHEILAQLVLGYRSAADLALCEDVTILDAAPLERDFPAAFPRWSLAPFWH